jgi:hydroxymethylpyrimidine pyrophosphatase-like HAD family hydrolase
MRENTYKLLQLVNNLVEFVPVTTRTIEQYRRLSLIVDGVPKFALVCNGAILLRNGEPDKQWLDESHKIFRDGLDRISDYANQLSRMPDCFLDVRTADGFFIFAKRVQNGSIAEKLEAMVDTALFDVCCIFEKVYIMPKQLDKGIAVERFLRLFGAGQASVSAGDSVLDLQMLKATDKAFVPYAFPFSAEFERAPNERFCEYILKNVISINQSKKKLNR